MRRIVKKLILGSLTVLFVAGCSAGGKGLVGPPGSSGGGCAGGTPMTAEIHGVL
jgi:hypothetical protein